MKKNPLYLALTVMLICAFVTRGFSQGEERQYYQLKTYTLIDDQQYPVMDAYLKDAYLPALKRLGIENVGVFKVRPDSDMKADKIYVLIPFVSLETFDNLEDMLAQDQAYISAGMPYIEAQHDNSPYERINSTLMKAFTEMPQMRPSEVDGPREDRVYELRSYESPTEATYRNKVAMFNKGGEVDLFEALGARAVFYGEVISGDRMPNLMYMTTFPNMEKRDALWEAFSSSDIWNELKADPQYQNNVKKSDIMLLYPTEYSDY